ncbi:MAG TPA: AMP-binding protein, partial [Burkholderiaceae bacterium]|nr:AMP-binding protein [Burkholderiaceae bacterium]
NTAYRDAEVSYFVTDAEPAILVCDPSREGAMRKLVANTPGTHVLTLDAQGQGSLSEAATSQPDEFSTQSCSADDLAAILYTSGTTGRSKGAMLSHGNLSSNAAVLHQYWGWSDADVLLHMLPIFHVHGLFVASHAALLAGARMNWLPRLDIDQALHYLPESTVMMGVPTYYVRLLDDPRFTADVCRNMRLFISGSAPLLIDTFEDFETRTGQRILERYGMSETIMLTSNPFHARDGQRLAGTVGRPLPGVALRIVNDEDQVVPTGEIGHVQVKGPNVFSGYWRMPEKTREEFTRDGWFRTGDMGCYGGDNIPADVVSIVGRNKDLIISGGYNVYPKEIELVIDEQPGVLESAVIGVPHADFGEAVVAAVVARTDAQPDEEQLRSTLKTQLAGFKVPKEIRFIPALPRNTMGKVQKNVLRETWSSMSADNPG